MKTAYLAGPIFGCDDSEAKDWRNYIIQKWGSDIYFLDPMRRDYRGLEGDYEREIVVLDKIDIDISDVVIVYYEQPSVGTSMEVLYAWERNVPVVIVTTQAKLSPWLMYHSTLVVDTFAKAIDFVERVPEKA
jgi:nucleoside 2-deoxyribosyltransferase